MATHDIPCAASSLLAGLVDGAVVELVEVVRTRVSVHYETADPDLPVLTVCTPDAVALPSSLVTPTLPAPGSSVHVGGGRLRADSRTWQVRRWWQPPRPRGLSRPALPALDSLTTQAMRSLGVPTVRPSYDGLSPSALVGAGPGLTPAGDDVLAGALVAASATADPRLPVWQGQTRVALSRTGTTAVSRAMLHHALNGYATPPLADLISALCLGEGIPRAAETLLAVGHSSGGALMAGAVHTFSTHHLEGAA